jgi:hypothetical protein
MTIVDSNVVWNHARNFKAMVSAIIMTIASDAIG